MAKPRMDLSAFVGKLLEEQDGDVLRGGIRVLSQAVMESEVAGLICAERHERTDDRKAYRNGARTRTWDTRVGTIELVIPRERQGRVSLLAAAAAPRGTRAARRGAGGVGPRHLDTEGRRPRQAARD